MVRLPVDSFWRTETRRREAAVLAVTLEDLINS
jgi:hypothetical protein